MAVVRIRWLAFALALVCVSAGQAPAQQAQEPEPVQQPERGPTLSPAAADERLRPGDAVFLRIWREETLSGEFRVDQDGVAIFPLIGPRHVTDDSPASLREKLIDEYRVYLVNPSIEVWPMRRVNILGAVGRPGLYTVDPTMTIADALAQAGGALPHGKPEEIELIREGERITANITQRISISELPLRSGDQLIVPERSWLERHSAIVYPFVGSLLITMINIRFR
jgi:polysaccharide biosynthesis/export protein